MIQVSKPSLGKEESDLVNRVFDSGWLGSGEYVIDFEKKINEFLGVENVTAVNTGTSAMHLAIEASGIGRGDEVIVPSLTFCATIQAIVISGATPVFCEVLPETLCIDPDHVERLITSKTRAVMPVHYAGIPSDMDRILITGKENNITVIEDAAHAFGSFSKGRRIGSFGDITCFSFDPIKNITCGEGGAVVVHNNAHKSAIIKNRRALGIDQDGWSRHQDKVVKTHEVIDKGYRYHLSNINAAIGLAQLNKINIFKTRKTEIVKQYSSAFSSIPEISLLNYTGEVFPFIYTTRVPGNKRDELMKFLCDRGISSSINYVPNHLQPAFKTGVSLSVTEKLYREIITLPLFVDMTDEQVGHVVQAVYDFFRKH